jgi:hypothetical protein
MFRDNLSVPSSSVKESKKKGFLRGLYRCFGMTYLSHLKGSRSPRRKPFFLDLLILEDGTDRFSETSIQNYHSRLRNTPEERGSHLHRDGSLKVGTVLNCLAKM